MMQGSTPQHYTIADFLKWNEDNELVLNPKFQRGSVWPPAARSYLIDSLLRDYPIPKILLRTTVDRDSRRTVRDVVDGQQRLKTIIDFAGDKYALGPKASEFEGLRYSDLEDEQKDSFLSYKITCEQLINASDEDVLEVFVRLNSNAVPVNEAELRNAKYENDFSELVKTIVRRTRPVWELGVMSNRDRVRMQDQSFVAEILGFARYGVTDGGELRISRIYEDLKTTPINKLPNEESIVQTMISACALLKDLAREPIVQRPHFLMLVAALFYKEGSLPQGRLDFSAVPQFDRSTVDDARVIESLRVLNAALSGEEVGAPVSAFIEARTTTHRMKSRQVRFEFFCMALNGQLARS